jgi:tetratricopeptide (TPR) repeat protein
MASPRAAWALFALVLTLCAAGCATTPKRDIAEQWYDIGNSWLDKGEWKKAGEAYSKALAIDPSFAGASLNFARALAEAGDYDGSLGVLDTLIKRDPGNVRVVAAKAFALYKKGDAAGALKEYRAVLELDPYAPDALYNVALLELESGDAQAAVKDLDLLSVNAPEDAEILLALGRARYESGDEEGALATYEKAKKLGKSDGAAYETMGLIYEKARRFSDAMDAFDAAVKLSPKRSLSWFKLARLKLIVASDAERGLEALKKAVDSGFSDKEAAAALLDEPDLPMRELALELLKAKGLVE